MFQWSNAQQLLPRSTEECFLPQTVFICLSNLMKSMFPSSIKMNSLTFHFLLLNAKEIQISLIFLPCSPAFMNRYFSEFLVQPQEVSIKRQAVQNRVYLMLSKLYRLLFSFRFSAGNLTGNGILKKYNTFFRAYQFLFSNFSANLFLF